MTDAPPSALARGMTWFGVGYFNDLQQTLVAVAASAFMSLSRIALKTQVRLNVTY